MDKTVTDDFEIMQVLDTVDNIGEDSLKDILSDFLCPMNREIEIFLKRNEVDSSDAGLSDFYFGFPCVAL